MKLIVALLFAVTLAFPNRSSAATLPAACGDDKTTFDCPNLGGVKPSPLGDGFSSQRRRVSLRNGRIPTRRAHSIRNPPALGMDDQIPEAGVGRRRGDQSAGSDSRDLRDTRCENHEGTFVEGPRASAGIDPATSDDQSATAMAEREDGAQDHGGISAH